MKERKSYKGTLNGVFGIWTDTKPEGVELQEEITFYVPDEGKVFVNLKTAESCDTLILQKGETLADYDEVEIPENPEEEENVQMD